MQNASNQTAEVLGSGDMKFVATPGWAQLPEGWKFHNVAGIAIDSKDNVFVFDRGPHPVIVFDKDGNFLRSWGDGQFVRPHAITIAPDDTVWLTDDANHIVQHCTADGKLLLTLGVPGSPAPYASGRPFNRCTHTAFSPEGDLYVSDGYGNACVHKYTPDGRLLLSWGKPGTMPGEFNVPHNITCDGDGWVYVADRENHRVQIFDGNGRFETQWNNLHKPCGMYMRPGRCPHCYIAEAGPHHMGVNRELPNIGPRVSILSSKGELLSRFGHRLSDEPSTGSFLGLHSIAVDSRGVMFVADLAEQTWKRHWPDRPPPPDLISLHRFAPVTDA